MYLLPDEWVIRELTERDYGIDLLVEIFAEVGVDKHQNKTYESTGAVFHIQIKGTASELQPKRNGKFSYSMSKYALSYFENFSTPCFLFLVDVSGPQKKSYFVWIQKYIKEVLDSKRPSWRTDKQDSFVIHVPPQNDVESKREKIQKIASRPRFIQEVVEFREIYFHLKSQLNNASSGKFKINKQSLDHMKLLARQIYNLNIIFKYNNCCIDKSNAEDLLHFVNSLTESSKLKKFADSPHQFNFDLLASSIENLSDVESFIAEHDDDTVY